MSIIGETIAVVTSVSQSVTVVTSIQNSWVSLRFSFSLTFSQEMRSKSVVGTISPSVTVGKTSMGIVGETGIAIVTSVTSIVAQSVTIVTTIQNSGISLGLGFSLRGSLDGTEQSNRQQDFHDSLCVTELCE